MVKRFQHTEIVNVVCPGTFTPNSLYEVWLHKGTSVEISQRSQFVMILALAKHFGAVILWFLPILLSDWGYRPVECTYVKIWQALNDG